MRIGRKEVGAGILASARGVRVNGATDQCHIVTFLGLKQQQSEAATEMKPSFSVTTQIFSFVEYLQDIVLSG